MGKHLLLIEQMTVAMVDRLVHHGYLLLLFENQIYRIRNSLVEKVAPKFLFGGC